MNTREITENGLWRQNPALVQLLGLCPLLAVSNNLVNGIVLGVLTLLVLTGANITLSLIKRLLSDETRLPTQILVIASFVTLADLLLQYVSFELHQRIGLFVALIVTNCVILGRAESFARKNHVFYAALDGFAMGCGFLLAIVVFSALREAAGLGTLMANAHLILGGVEADWIIRLPNEGLLLAILPPGAFILFGLLIALKNWIDHWYEQRQTIRNSKAA